MDQNFTDFRYNKCLGQQLNHFCIEDHQNILNSFSSILSLSKLSVMLGWLILNACSLKRSREGANGILMVFIHSHLIQPDVGEWWGRGARCPGFSHGVFRQGRRLTGTPGATREPGNLDSCPVFSKCLLSCQALCWILQMQDEPGPSPAFQGLKVRCQRWIYKELIPLKSVRDAQGIVGLQGRGSLFFPEFKERLQRVP